MDDAYPGWGMVIIEGFSSIYETFPRQGKNVNYYSIMKFFIYVHRAVVYL